jgi:hypothetical protein
LSPLNELKDVFTEQGLPSKNISFSGNWGLLNIFGVRTVLFPLYQPTPLSNHAHSLEGLLNGTVLFPL